MEIPQNKKVVYDTQVLSLAIAGQYAAYNKKLREGVCIGASVVSFTTDKGHAVNVGVTDSSGTEILGASDYRDWAKTGGEYLKSLKPCNFDTRGSVNINIAASVALAVAFDAQIIFAILIDK